MDPSTALTTETHQVLCSHNVCAMRRKVRRSTLQPTWGTVWSSRRNKAARYRLGPTVRRLRTSSNGGLSHGPISNRRHQNNVFFWVRPLQLFHPPDLTFLAIRCTRLCWRTPRAPCYCTMACRMRHARHAVQSCVVEPFQGQPTWISFDLQSLVQIVWRHWCIGLPGHDTISVYVCGLSITSVFVFYN